MPPLLLGTKMRGFMGAEPLPAHPMPGHRASSARKEAPCENAYKGSLRASTANPRLMIQFYSDPMGKKNDVESERVLFFFFWFGSLESDPGIRIPMKVFY